MRDVAFMQHVVHAIVQGTSIYHDMERLIEEQIENMSNSEDLEEVPPPFKEWDES